MEFSAADRQQLIARGTREFINRLGAAPTWGAIAPGRVNLIGEHTDYNDGFVMPLAIDRYTFVCASVAGGNMSTLVAHDLGDTGQADFTTALAPSGGVFADYVLAVVDQFKKQGDALPKLNVLITGSIPRGSGLSSSASLEVAVATVLEQVVKRRMTPRDKALLCRRAENEFIGVPCGIMDMFVITLARERNVLMIDCRSLHHEPLPFATDGDVALLVVDSGVDRSLRSGEYGGLRAMCASAARKLGLAALRDATEHDIRSAANLDDDERKRAMHVVAENRRVLQAAEALRNSDWNALGDLMFASHRSLRDLYRVSTPELDLIVDTAMRLRITGGGALGARLTGAGFGGCAIVLCRGDAVDDISAAIDKAFENRFNRQPRIMQVHAVGGAEPVKF